MILLLIQAVENESDRNLLTALYLKYQRLFLKKAQQCSGDNHAEDILQEAMLRVIRRVDTLKTLTEPQMVAYIDRAIFSCAMNHRRKEAGEPETSTVDDVADLSLEDIADRLDRSELSTRLGLELAKLPEQKRNVLIYKYIFQYNDDEIAELLAIKPDSIRMVLTRARRDLHQSIMEGGEI